MQVVWLLQEVSTSVCQGPQHRLEQSQGCKPDLRCGGCHHLPGKPAAVIWKHKGVGWQTQASSNKHNNAYVKTKEN